MIKELILQDNKEYFPFNTSEVYPSRYGIALGILVNDNNNFDDILKDKSLVRQAFDDQLDFYMMDDPGLYVEEIKSIKNILDNIDSSYEELEYVKLAFENIDPLIYIENNNDLLDKKIVLDECVRIDEQDKILELIKKYENVIDNIYITMQNNSGYVLLKDCILAQQKIKEEANYINSLDLSPFEKVMYTYDFIKRHEYNMESEEESEFESRNLNNILFGDRIVCAGFANYFDALLRHMNFSCDKTLLSDRRGEPYNGHVRNCVYIKDDKYNIDGAYYFDTTFDSKDSSFPYNYIKYRYFAKTRNEIDLLDNDTFLYDNFPYYATNMVKDAKRLLSNGQYFLYNKDYAGSVNYLGRLVYNGKDIIDRDVLIKNHFNHGSINCDEIYNKLKDLSRKYNRQIPGEVYLKALCEVRKIEHEIDPEEYPNDMLDIINSFRYSMWNMKDNYLDLRVFKIFGQSIPEEELGNNSNRNVFKFIMDNDIILEKDNGTKKLK